MNFLQRNLFTKLRADNFGIKEEMEPMTTFKKKKIGDRFGVDNRKAASILDTFSCMVQGLIPYGVQMLLAAGLANLSPMDILPYLYYPLAIGVAALLAILLRYPKRYS